MDVDGLLAGEERVVDIWRMSVRAWREMLKVDVCVIRNSVSMCFWNLHYYQS